MNEVSPTSPCPSCGVLHDDFDGFGVLSCSWCGFCSHPSINGDICAACARDTGQRGVMNEELGDEGDVWQNRSGLVLHLSLAVERLQGIVGELVEPLLDCKYDHNGLCQAHFLDTAPCPVERARAMLNDGTTGGAP